MLTSQQKNTCHSPLQTPKICLTTKEKPHSLFIALPRIVLSFHLYSGSQIVVLSEVAWHAWKCVAYFVTWSGCCMHFHIFGFYCIRSSSFWCSTNLRWWSVTTSAEVLLVALCLSKHYLVNLHVETRFVVLCGQGRTITWGQVIHNLT